jgi:hypothetical protein
MALTDSDRSRVMRLILQGRARRRRPGALENIVDRGERHHRRPPARSANGQGPSRPARYADRPQSVRGEMMWCRVDHCGSCRRSFIVTAAGPGPFQLRVNIWCPHCGSLSGCAKTRGVVVTHKLPLTEEAERQLEHLPSSATGGVH